MAARAFSKICFSRPQRSKLHIGLLLAMLAILVPDSVGFTQGLPRVVLKGPSEIQQPASPLEICIIVSWEGDAGNYIIVPPEPVFPESFSLRSSSFEATVSDSLHQLTYRFILVPRQTGQFTIYPVDIRCWPRDNTTELSLLTNECAVTVAHGARLSQKKVLAAAAAIMLVIITIAVYMTKRRAACMRSSTQPETKLDSETLVQQCRSQRLQGDYTAFYTTALQAARALSPADQNLHNRITASLERARFSSGKPSIEDVDQVLRQLERARNHTEQT